MANADMVARILALVMAKGDKDGTEISSEEIQIALNKYLAENGTTMLNDLLDARIATADEVNEVLDEILK